MYRRISNMALAAAAAMLTWCLFFLLAACGNSETDDKYGKYGVYYEIFVRSFADSDGDGIGDIRGLTSMLDYLNDGNDDTDTDLGINGIYLMPVNVSPSYHKYDVTDYYDIDPEYGTLEDFEHFLDEAHKRGIRVIMDLVVNHTGRDHPWFRESSSSAESRYRDYYNWADEASEGCDINAVLPSGSRLWHRSNGSFYYGYFWDGMPDLNYDDPRVRKEIKDIARFWLKKGVDGFRLDAAMHIYGVYEKPAGTDLPAKNIEWWQEFRNSAEEVKRDVYLVGEVWDKAYAAAPYYKGFDSLFNFDLGEGIITTLHTGSANAVSSKGFAWWLLDRYETYGSVRQDFIDAPFLTNHDQDRIMTRLRGDVEKAKLAAAIYLTLPGNPFIYYGEEIGMTGSKPDEMIRVPFKWYEEHKLPQCSWQSALNNAATVPVEIQQNDPDSLLSHYKKLIRVRQSSEALMLGGFEPVQSGNRAVIAYERSWSDGNGKDNAIVLYNVSSDHQQVQLDIKHFSADVIFDSGKTDLKAGNGTEADRLVIVMSPMSTVILDVDK